MDADLYKFPTREEWLIERFGDPELNTKNGDYFLPFHPIYDVAKHFITVPEIVCDVGNGPEKKKVYSQDITDMTDFSRPMNIAIFGAYAYKSCRLPEGVDPMDLPTFDSFIGSAEKIVGVKIKYIMLSDKMYDEE